MPFLPTAIAEAGLFTLLMDGVAIDSVDLGSITGGQTLRNTLGASISLSPGSHQLSIEMTRPYLNGGGAGIHARRAAGQYPPVTAVPEPSG